MFSEIASSIVSLICAVIGLVFSAIIVPWLKNTAIPWLVEKRVYSLVQKFVNAAEKMGETGALDKSAKKQFVVDLLKRKGIDVTPEIEAFIESAVEALDLALSEGLGDVADEFKQDEPASAGDAPKA